MDLYNRVRRHIFQPGVSESLDAIVEEIETKKQIYHHIANRISKLIGIDNSVKVDLNDKYGWHMYVTKNRYKILRKLDSSYQSGNIKVPNTSFSFLKESNHE